MCTLSLLTSSTRLPLDEIVGKFVRPTLADSLELYLARLTDRDALSLCGPVDRHKSPAYLMSRLGYPCGDRLAEDRIRVLAEDIEHLLGGSGKLKCIATYFPEITSADRELRNHAINALEVAIRLADKLKVPWVECVGGRSDEECVHEYTQVQVKQDDLEKPDCEIVMSYQDYTDPDARNQIPIKAEWLVDALKKVHRRLMASPTNIPVRCLLEMEPGPLFVLSRRRTVNHVLKEMESCTVPNSDLPFIGVNCDIGHLSIMAYRPPKDPGVVWHEILEGLGRPSEYTGNFHISWHPYLRVHLDHPPTADRRYRIPETEEEGFEGKWGVPKALIPWLNCVLCVSEHRPGRPANLSLELEAASRDELVVVGMRAIRKAMEHLSMKRQTNPSWVMRACKSCPQKPRRVP